MPDLLEAVNLYSEGLHESDVLPLKEVLHPESTLFDADTGQYILYQQLMLL